MQKQFGLPRGLFNAIDRRLNVATVLALGFALCAASVQAQPPSIPANKTSSGGQKASAAPGGIAVNASDSAQVIIQRDPEVGRLLKMLEQQQKDREASEHFHRQQLQTAQQKNEEQARELRNLQARAIEYVVQQAAQPNASPAATAAKRGLEAGHTQLSEALLRESERTAAAQGHDSLRRAAELARQQGALALLHEGTNAALGAYRRATEYEPDSVWNWGELGDLFVQAGNLTEAARAYQQMLTLSTAKAAQDPIHTEWQRDLLVSHTRIGDVLVTNGKLDEALVAYRTGLVIAETLAAKDASNTQWQRDLWVSYNKSSDVLVQHGKLDDALAAYRKGLAIAETLATKDATNTQWQRDLLVSHDKIGNVLVTNGKWDEALAAYRKGLAIAETLATKDATNTQWQRDLSVSHERIGGVLVTNGKLDDGLASYRKGLAIGETLAAKDATNTLWQRDLSVSHTKIGDVLATNGKRDEALAAYRKGLAIRETLAAKDATNTEWQRDLLVSHTRIGDVLVQHGKRDDALVAYRNGLAIAETLAAKDATNTLWQRDVAVSCSKLGMHAGLAAGERRDYLRRGLDILQKQKTLGQLPPTNQAWIEVFEKHLQEVSMSDAP